jgi:hypothetical protein
MLGFVNLPYARENKMGEKKTTPYSQSLTVFIVVVAAVCCLLCACQTAEATLTATVTPSPSETRVSRTPTPTRIPYRSRTFAPTVTITFTPSITFTPTITLTSTPIQYSGKIAGVCMGYEESYAFDENVNPLFPAHADSFSADGCRYQLIHPIDYGFEYSEEDLLGNELWSKVALSEVNEDELYIFQYSLSPSGEWIAYRRADQWQWGMDITGAEIQDVVLLPVNDKVPQPIMNLTSRGGSHAPLAWSPDGQYLAYTDYDDAGLNQVFVYDLEKGKETQLTRFLTQTDQAIIIRVLWSPDSQSLLFVRRDFNVKTEVGIIRVENKEIKWITLQFENYGFVSEPYGQHQPWWDNQSQVLLLTVEMEEGNRMVEYLIWYDLSNDKIEDILSAREAFDEPYFGAVVPMDNLGRVILMGPSFPCKLYTRTTHEFKEIYCSFSPDWLEIIIPPNGPVDVDQCKRVSP